MATQSAEATQLGAIFVPISKAYDKAEENLQPNEAIHERILRIRESQIKYSNLLGKLNCIIADLRLKYRLEESTNAASVHNETASSTESGFSSETSTACTFQLSASNCTKPKLNQIETDDFIEIDLEDINEYPRYVSGTRCVIGPNETEVDARLFDDIVWTSPAVATRLLLGLVFTDDILATHTLTGKPSPAFYGRERPSKMQLDPQKTSDIIHCVLVKCGGCSKQEVRSTITAKCADTARKYKRQDAKKKLL